MLLVAIAEMPGSSRVGKAARKESSVDAREAWATEMASARVASLSCFLVACALLPRISTLDLSVTTNTHKHIRIRDGDTINTRGERETKKKKKKKKKKAVSTKVFEEEDEEDEESYMRHDPFWP